VFSFFELVKCLMKKGRRAGKLVVMIYILVRIVHSTEFLVVIKLSILC
jgi:ribosomal protein L14E/L6E/L27E